MNKISNGDYALQLLLSTKGPFFRISEKMGVYRHHQQGMHKVFERNDVFLKRELIKLLYFFDLQTDFAFHEIIEERITGFLKKLKNNMPPVSKYVNTKDSRPLSVKLFSKRFWLRKLKLTNFK
jgi:hypothetical protein